MKDIPVHQLQDRTSAGLQLQRFQMGDLPDDDADTFGAHRDDHYIFFVLEKGSGSIMIDFQEFNLAGGSLFYVLPSQVHHRIRNEAAGGWFIAVDTLLIPPDFRNVFENRLLIQHPYELSDVLLRQFCELLCLLYEKYKDDDADIFYLPVVHTLLQSFLGMAARCYNEFPNVDFKLSRPVELSREFKKLLRRQLRTMKSPSAYADQLNVSESYLNEMLKKITGFPVSYWIQQEVMMEARRLLYYSNLNIKEIAHALGYPDNSYFSRLFRKVVGQSAIAFRAKYRK